MVDLLRILLIEDNAGDVRLIQESLKQSEIPSHLDVFAEGKGALEFALGDGKFRNHNRPHIIILDLNLPGWDGGEILRRLKGDERTRAIPVIIFSSSAAATDIHRCYDLHANCYIQKPIDLNSTFHVIKSLETFWAYIVRLPNS